jgi:hypothetical protein
MNDITARYPTAPVDPATVPPAAGVRPGPAVGPEGAAEGPSRPVVAMLAAATAGAGVAVALGTYGRLHRATGEAITTFGFPGVLPMKVWLASVAAALALAQLLSAAWMWGRLPGAPTPAPRAVATAHRWTGTVAFVVSLPVAYHCLWSLGFRTTDARVLTHSILGCAFYGAFVTKMMLLRSRHLPGWTLPVAGGALVALLTGLWLTSAAWFFTTVAPGA